MNFKTLFVSAIVAASIVPAAAISAESKSTAQKSEAAQFAADAAITTKVKSAFLAEKNLNSLDISVETLNGVVQLSGFVVSSAQIQQATDVAKHVKGVKDVKNDLRLKTDTQP